MASTVNLSDLGRRVRVARLARRMTLEDVVSRTEFTVSWLSKLENGQLSPSLEGLVRLADVLECGVDTLVAGLSVPPQYVVVKRGCGRIDQRRTSDGGIVAECLADQWRNRAMDPVILRVTAAGNRRHPDNHDGERFLLVLDGAVEVASVPERWARFGWLPGMRLARAGGSTVAESGARALLEGLTGAVIVEVAGVGPLVAPG
jgi:transcriptional regulator with XRE-family HTH domain